MDKAVRMHLEGMMEDGEPIPEPSSIARLLDIEVQGEPDINPHAMKTNDSGHLTSPIEIDIFYNHARNGFMFFIIYIGNYEHNDETIKLRRGETIEHNIRRIAPFNNSDFLDWLYEFINFWGIQPKAFSEYIKEDVEKLIILHGQEKRIKWEGEFISPKRTDEHIGNVIDNVGVTRKDVIKYFKSLGIEFSERTFIFYESERLLPKPRKIGRTNYYKRTIFKDIEKILNFKKEGKTLRDIKKIISIDNKIQ